MCMRSQARSVGRLSARMQQFAVADPTPTYDTLARVNLARYPNPTLTLP